MAHASTAYAGKAPDAVTSRLA
ncbi:MAG: hypothetical protein JWP52_4352, partial [Rhizobacter sp.]|nr:hypothetical protein [Rhizobacter sp.]